MNIIMIAVTEVHAEIQDIQGDLQTVLIAAMKATRNHWMVTEEMDRLNAAVGATLLHFGEGTPEYERLSLEMKRLNRLNAALVAAQSGVPVDFATMCEEKPKFKPLGIMKLWKEQENG